MSPILITVLVVGGILILLLIGYLNHAIEANKIEKARRKAELSDRLRRCELIDQGLPAQLMTPALKLFLSRIQLHYVEQLLVLEKSNARLSALADELKLQLAKGESITISNSKRKIASEAIAKDIRFQLEGLHALIVHAQQTGFLGAGEAKKWVLEIKHMLTLLHLELFITLGNTALQQHQPGQARLAFERGVQYLSKNPERERYLKQFNYLKQQLAQANAVVLQQRAPETENSQLAEALKTMDEEEQWKKKSLYD